MKPGLLNWIRLMDGAAQAHLLRGLAVAHSDAPTVTWSDVRTYQDKAGKPAFE